MAAIIDGTTYEGYWKLTPANSSPDEFYLIPKGQIVFDAIERKLCFVSDFGLTTTLVTVASDTIDGQGNALATNSAVSEYLKTWR